MARARALVSIFALAFALAAVSFGEASAAPPNPMACSAQIEFDLAFLSAASSSSQPTEAHAGARVSIAIPPTISVQATMTAWTDLGWAVAVSPSVITASSTDVSSWVELVVTVPPGEEAGTTARVTLDVDLEGGLYRCEDASSSDLSITVAPTVERFNGFIVSDSLVVTDDARRVAFRVEFEATANAAISVSIQYVVEPQMTVDAPRSLVLNPQEGGHDNTSIDVFVATPRQFTGSYEFTMLVRAEVEGSAPIEGELGMTVYVPRSTEGDWQLPAVGERMANAILIFAATAAAGTTAAVGWWLRGRLRR